MSKDKNLKNFMSKMVSEVRGKKDHESKELHEEQVYVLGQINELAEVLRINKLAAESIEMLVTQPELASLFERSSGIMDILISPAMVKGIYLPYTGNEELDKMTDEVYSGTSEVKPPPHYARYSLLPADAGNQEMTAQWVRERGILGRVVPAIDCLVEDHYSQEIDSVEFENLARAIIYAYLTALYEDSANIDFYSFREVDYIRKVICTTNFEYFLLPRKIYLVADYANTLKRDIHGVADIVLPSNRIVRHQFSRLANGAGTAADLFKAIAAWSEMVGVFLGDLLKTTQKLMEDQTKPYMSMNVKKD